MPILTDKEKRKKLREDLYKDLAGSGRDICDTVKVLRKITAQDQKTFAESVGISLSALRRIEQGHDNFNMSTLNKILQKYSMSLVVVRH